MTTLHAATPHRNKRHQSAHKDADSVERLLGQHPRLHLAPERGELIDAVLRRKEAITLRNGALATWNPAGETGRVPKDTYTVRRGAAAETVDWTSDAAIPMEPETFDALVTDALHVMESSEELFTIRRAIGADLASAMPLRLVSNRALPVLFGDNMFRPRPEGIEESVLADQEFTVLVLPEDKIDVSRYADVLREENGKPVPMLVATDYERRIGVVYGLSYLGAIKKLLFTAANTLLPAHGVLPLHCSAAEDAQGRTTLFLGLSGTGKTTLSNHPGTRLIGDDEHGWSDAGITNFENGCFAKLIHLDPAKEPDIREAAFTDRPVRENGVIVENAMVFPDGTYDLDDERLTQNSRVSYPLAFHPRCKESARGTHPSVLLFLTADANGVLPPVARLDRAEAQLWFLMGYTSKLAGTEAGVKEPMSTFSHFFGGPFMLRQPADYATLLDGKLREHGCDVYLINTGWTGGPYGTGERIDIDVSRAIVEAALSGTLRDADYRRDERFRFSVPKACSGVDARLLDPRGTWDDPAAYDRRADTLAAEFAAHFQEAFAGRVGEDIRMVCPGIV